MNYSKALDKLVRGLELTDVWATTHPRAIYTHYTPTRSSTTRPFVCLPEPMKPQNRCGNSDGSIHRSFGGVLAYNPRCATDTTWARKMENECKATGGGILEETNTTGMGKME